MNISKKVGDMEIIKDPNQVLWYGMLTSQVAS